MMHQTKQKNINGYSFISGSPQNNSNEIVVIDSHTEGEPTRVVIHGGPDLGNGTLVEKLDRFKANYDHFRSAIVNEPRGSDVYVGALYIEPDDDTTIGGVIFFNNVGYLGMCGHGTIGLVKTLHYMGKITTGEHILDTPVGKVTVTLCDNKVSVKNVPSYRKHMNVPVKIDDTGTFHGDIAWGGNWFYLCEDHNMRLEQDNVELLIDFAWKLRKSVNEQGYPEVDHIELCGPSSSSLANSRNFVLCPGKAYDRSPCGTGTSARIACLAAEGLLAEESIWIQESIIGSRFEARYKWDGDKVIPIISGNAYINAESRLLIDTTDPFCWGIKH